MSSALMKQYLHLTRILHVTTDINSFANLLGHKNKHRVMVMGLKDCVTRRGH